MPCSNSHVRVSPPSMARLTSRPGHQHGLGAQQALQLAAGQVGGVEVFGVGPGAHGGAAGLLRRVADAGQGLDHVAAGEHQAVTAAVAHDFHLEAVGQGVGDGHADPVQAAGETVGGVVVGLVELAAGVQAGEDHFNGGHAFHRVDLDRNAATVVGDADRAVQVQGDADLLAEAGHGLIGGVVDDFLDDVERVFGAGVHPRSLFDRLEALQHGDGIGVVGLLGHAGNKDRWGSGALRTIPCRPAQGEGVRGAKAALSVVGAAASGVVGGLAGDALQQGVGCTCSRRVTRRRAPGQVHDARFVRQGIDGHGQGTLGGIDGVLPRELPGDTGAAEMHHLGIRVNGCGLFEGGPGACQHVTEAARWRRHQPFGLDGIHQRFASVGVAGGRDGQMDEGVSQDGVSEKREGEGNEDRTQHGQDSDT
jgi:hypothetical protein